MMNNLSCGSLHSGQELILVDQIVEGKKSNKYNVGWYSPLPLVEQGEIDETLRIVCESTDGFAARIRVDVATGVAEQSFDKRGCMVRGEQFEFESLNDTFAWMEVEVVEREIETEWIGNGLFAWVKVRETGTGLCSSARLYVMLWWHDTCQ